MIFDIDYFIAKFEAIPEDQWTVGVYEKDGKCCAVGHCGYRDLPNGEFVYTPEGKALWGISDSVAAVNDGKGILSEYAPTPKQRVLKHLRALKHMEATGK